MKKNEEELRRANQTIDDLEQYGRKTMLEISGFPRQEKESAIGLVLKLAEHLDVDLNETGIEACHRISPKADAAIIVEFSSRRKRDKFFGAKKKMKNFTIVDFGFEIGAAAGMGKIYINESLTKKRKGLLREIKSEMLSFGNLAIDRPDN
eukprot:gene20944-biopygen15451